MSTVLPDFWPGQVPPDFLIPGPGESPATFYERFCGRKTVVAFAPDIRSLPELNGLLPAVGILGVVPATSVEVQDPPYPVVRDSGRIAAAFLGEPNASEPMVAVLRTTLTIEKLLRRSEFGQIRYVLDALPDEPSRVCNATAPVLLVPNVLPPALCSRLIAAHDADHFESGMLRHNGAGVVLEPDAVTKKRRDHRLTDPELSDAVTEALGARLLPAIARAFHYPVTRMEGYKVVAYDAVTGGYFRPHRDNSTPDARHRRFALSVNLNAEYSGGDLEFPEFGPCLYRAPAGGAVVFSGTLLHAARDVTVGRRYVLLSFLWGEEAPVR
ncbi:2OG-Fe(II) oxygenase [Thioalkalivibrio sp. ALE9]|uniref:2OG-Fe(II) oxygenase n=1 Tax=Thioalkalivibrio sp. ALE9 TaxID=1158169 RepID=UPI00037F8AA9|nr:2OG-Fe(II) oxygenase [Thioalkalivibrio sp. ALE9]